MEKKMTAVEWLEQEYAISKMLTANDFKKAKEIEKQETIEAQIEVLRDIQLPLDESVANNSFLKILELEKQLEK